MESVNIAAKAWSDAGIANIYEKTRPDYNLDSVEFLLKKTGAFEHRCSSSEPFTIVELGAGTGKFTRAVLKVFAKHDIENFKIIATEPLKEMCEKLREMVVAPNVEILQCSASDLTGSLDKCTANTILAAQCFHWFGMQQKALDGIYQILKPQGILGILWNLPDRSVSWIKTFEEWLDPKFEAVKIPRPAHPIMFVPLRGHGGFVNERVDEETFKYFMEFDIDGVIDRYRAFANNSAHTILAAQSFHWFYSDQKAVNEILRVLRPGGIFGLIFYVPDRSISWIRRVEEMLDQKYEEVDVVNTYHENILVPLKKHCGLQEVVSDISSFVITQVFDQDGVVERYKTKSIVSASTDKEKIMLLQAIKQILRDHDAEKYIFKYGKKIHCFQKL